MKKILVALFAIVSIFSITACAEMIFDYDFLNQLDETPVPEDPVIEADKVIYYTTTDGKVIYPKDFTNPIVYNVYKDGQGVLLCKNTIYTIPEGAFAGFSNLRTVVLPEKTNTLYARAFASCSKLEYVILNKNLATIGERVFNGCTALNTIYFHDAVAVEKIGTYAFYGCSSLTTVIISDLSAWCRIEFKDEYSNPLSSTIASMSHRGLKLKSLEISSDVTSIKQYAFYYLNGVFDITVGNAVTSIGEYAFFACDVQKLTLGRKVEKIAAKLCKAAEYRFGNDFSLQKWQTDGSK